MEGKDVVDGKMVVKITAVCKTETIAEEVGHSKVISGSILKSIL